MSISDYLILAKYQLELPHIITEQARQTYTRDYHTRYHLPKRTQTTIKRYNSLMMLDENVSYLYKSGMTLYNVCNSIRKISEPSSKSGRSRFVHIHTDTLGKIINRPHSPPDML